jgi:hypothetical protein
MSALNYILYTEKMVGATHPTLSDTLNRALRQLLTQAGQNPDADGLDLYVVPAGHAMTLNGPVRCVQFDNGNSGAAITIDFAVHGNSQRVTLSSATVAITLANAAPGGAYILEVVQDSTGGRVATWAASPGAVLWPGGTTPTVTATALRADVFSFFYDGVPGTTKYLGFVNGQNFAV